VHVHPCNNLLTLNAVHMIHTCLCHVGANVLVQTHVKIKRFVVWKIITYRQPPCAIRDRLCKHTSPLLVSHSAAMLPPTSVRTGQSGLSSYWRRIDSESCPTFAKCSTARLHGLLRVWNTSYVSGLQKWFDSFGKS